MKEGTLKDFWDTRKERGEKTSTVLVVIGMHVIVLIYDVFTGGSHTIKIVMKSHQSRTSEIAVVKVPEMFVIKAGEKETYLKNILNIMFKKLVSRKVASD